MTTLYAMAANMHYRVCSTGNRSEAFIGYTTKWEIVLMILIL